MSSILKKDKISLDFCCFLSITMTQNTILEEVYEAIVKGSDIPHIPHSSVFHAQKAYYNHSGHWVDLDRMERAMYLEGMLSARQVLDPERPREWE